MQLPNTAQYLLNFVEVIQTFMQKKFRFSLQNYYAYKGHKPVRKYYPFVQPLSKFVNV